MNGFQLRSYCNVHNQLCLLLFNLRAFWEILNSSSWTNRLRITQGKLQTTFIEGLKRLLGEKKIDVYESVKYTSSANQMKKFMRRGTLTTITKQYEKEKDPIVRTKFNFWAAHSLVHEYI